MLTLVAKAALALTLLAPTTVAAQESNVPMFADIPWGTTAAHVRAKMVAKGYTFRQADKDKDYLFLGKYRTTDMLVWAMFDAQRKLVKVYVSWLPPESRYYQFYQEMQTVLTEKYGLPQSTYETYEWPFVYGDGHRDTAVQMGDADIATSWAWPPDPLNSAAGLTLRISERFSVGLSYESPAWSAEADRRTKADAKDL